MKCKHESGWLVQKNPSVFVAEDETVILAFQDLPKQGAKLLAGCNRRCGAVRTVYIKAEVVKWGKVKTA